MYRFITHASFEVSRLVSLDSGQNNLDIASAAGADMTLAESRWLAGACMDRRKKNIIFHEITEIKLNMYQFNYLLAAACYAFLYMNFDVQVSVPQTKRRQQGYFRRQSRNHSSSQCEALIASSCQKEASLGSLFQP